MASPGMGATDVACIRRGRPRFCQEGRQILLFSLALSLSPLFRVLINHPTSTGPLRTAVPRGTPYQRILRMAVSAQYARQANLHGRAFTVPPRATLRRSLAVPPPPSPSPRKPAMALTDEVMRPGRNGAYSCISPLCILFPSFSQIPLVLFHSHPRGLS
jgi:hypothetical protein